ncbi:hypothetical protein [Mycolicibacterium grossiae]|uniref:hypothetical protein n=1 Tax=Mycolicibacterium grossiae TaxID=1552759 RepID=UPI001478F0C1|nr:hypothetical protein [Mycolicibacterium grossiae]
MFTTLLTHTASRFAIRWRLHDAPVPADDGACPICDHPFGHMRHACIGADVR